MANNKKPNNFFTSTIHMPARGKKLNDVEKVPIINNGILRSDTKGK